MVALCVPDFSAALIPHSLFQGNLTAVLSIGLQPKVCIRRSVRSFPPLTGNHERNLQAGAGRTVSNSRTAA